MCPLLSVCFVSRPVKREQLGQPIQKTHFGLNLECRSVFLRLWCQPLTLVVDVGTLHSALTSEKEDTIMICHSGVCSCHDGHFPHAYICCISPVIIDSCGTVSFGICSTHESIAFMNQQHSQTNSSIVFAGQPALCYRS